MKKSVISLFNLALLLLLAGSCSKDPLLTGNLSSEIVLSTQAVTSISQNSAVSGVLVSGGFSSDILDKGICWGTTTNPITTQNKLSGATGLTLTNLAPSTIYYIRGYVTTKNETIYGDQKQFSTLAYQLATLTTTAVSGITQTTAVSGGDVTALGGGTVTAKGICWSTVSGPTTANSRTIDGSGLGIYSSGISSLNPGTTYYVRAYATNQAGTAYGAQISFTTTVIQLATVSGVTVSAIARTTATISGSVTADGGGTITSRGVCWSTSTNPTVPASSYTTNGSGTGVVSGSLTGLVTGTTYYVRAYAINAAGISYGTLTSFKTL